MSYLTLVGVGLLLGATGVALAADSTRNTTPSATTNAAGDDDARDRDERKADKARHDRGKRGGGYGRADGRERAIAKRLVARGALHGKFVVAAAEGKFETLVVQRGEVTAVSATSISLKSPDGFARTYAITGDTRVRARGGAISSIEKGGRASVVAVKTGSSLTARVIRDSRGSRGAGAKTKPKPTPGATTSGAAT